MFKKTLIAAALVAVSSTAVAGTIRIAGEAYKVGNEYLNSYTGTALEGNLQTGSIGITYKPGIALGINNTLKFTFSGGALAADTGLKLQKITVFADATTAAAIEAAVDAAIAAVADATVDATDTAALKAAAVAAANDEVANDSDFDVAKFNAAVNALAVDTYANTTTAIEAIEALSAVIPTTATNVADLVDFETDSNGDYTWVLFKITDNGLTSSEVIIFNDTDDDGAANVTTKFTKATIGAGDLKVALPEAKDDTGVSLSAPIAASKTLVTTANQFAVTTTKATDTIDVEQDRLFFSDSISDAVTTAFTVAVVQDGTVVLGIDKDTADFEVELSGNATGIDSVTVTETQTGDATDDSGDLDANLKLAGDGINDLSIAATVDGTTNLATRTLDFTLMVTPSEADTEAFYLVGSASTGVNAFEWDLNGSEVTFPYAPIGYSNVTTNFELANSGDQTGDVLITAFTRAGVSYSGILVDKATAMSLTKIGEIEVYDALGLAAGTSLSVTFSTTAPDADIKISGYSNLSTGGRMALLSDAYEGKINP
jgi:hypothetical protein